MGFVGELGKPINLLLLAAIAVVAFYGEALWIGLALGAFAMVLMGSSFANTGEKRKRDADSEIYEEGVDADTDDDGDGD
ncbi:MAG: hypothetical protein V1835_03480 [Candidatus Micrarchaeota archaeon]